ncbi:alanyl-tRNA editing protein [Clostridiaceae bacterium UIB06]|uniref:Alanyl-tRNA editing protein n=1 Tax=Clostridium thailandense TaxID=2794346 RepID=A0A949TZW0_9CLOT|nr:DHHA1 domain-containing protein [Clostridium thailandense]MBV7274861.1 alanyl-tRNA editing protein [Clostridium thailandense]MCH5137606.1 alanyl-tRNA editing protein [Clostridiaceae bacterium UIB06]
MTEKLFYKDAYLKDCEAEVVDIINENGKVLVVLDKTIFYPEGGGQPSDIGEIDGIKVTYVSEKDGIIYHQMDEVPKSKKVFCKIDFNRRFDHMQQHAGEHLLSGAILRLYGGNNKGFHLGTDYVTVDIDINEISEEMVAKIEEEVNNYIYANEPIKTFIVSKEECKNYPLRKQINVDEDIRIVEVKDMDCCACCGTHVSYTSEVGIVKIIKSERYKGMTRIYCKCGKRAFTDFENKHNVITKLNRYFSVDEDNLFDRVMTQCSELDALKREIAKLKRVFAENEAKQLEAENSKIILKEYNDKSFDDVQLIASVINNKEHVLILSSAADKKIIFMNGTSLDINCGKIFKENIKEFNGKGGGNAQRAQGTFDTEEDLMRFSEFLDSCVKG